MSIRNLRKRKTINYKEVMMGSTPTTDKDESFRLDSDDESSGAELFSKKKNTEVDKMEISLQIFNDNFNFADDSNEYRLQRRKNLEERLNVLRSLEIDEEIEQIQAKLPIPKKPSAKKGKPTPEPVARIRFSLRLQDRTSGSSVQQTDTDISEIVSEKEEPSVEEDIPISELETEEEILFFESLKENLNVPYEVESEFSKYEFPEFTDSVKSCQMLNGPTKVIRTRITSLDFHPSQTSLHIIVGAVDGNIALWNLAKNDGVSFRVHTRNVNCVSFSLRDNNKFFSTSLDGTFRQGDVESMNSHLVYTSTSNVDSHLTWHHEFDQSMLVAQGNGSVRLLDLREPSSREVSYKCHKRSCRTVQLHPTNENYFLTSSGTGQFSIWDLRNSSPKKSSPVNNYTFEKGLTSAFFSAQGNYILATCNDDSLQIFDSSTLHECALVKRITHNNHTGQWLSVFKARWQPQREDAFFVGSMMQPRRIQLYQRNGKLFHELRSENLVTITPAIACHPSQPIYVGGNGSGKIHVFTPYTDLSSLN